MIDGSSMKASALACGAAWLLLSSCSSSDAKPNATLGGAGASAKSLQLPGEKFYPESLSATSDGQLYVGSIATGAVVKFGAGETSPTVFLAPGGTLKGVAGVLVDTVTNSLFVCAVDSSFQITPNVRRYDLATGALFATYSLPGTPAETEKPNPALGFPNDLAFDASHRLYVTDSFGGRVYRVSDLETSSTMSLWATDPSLAPTHMGTFGADGISWDGAGFFVNNNDTGALVRIGMNSDGSAAAVTQITVQPVLQHPDGQRQLDAHTLLVVDNTGSIRKLAVNASAATSIDVRSGLDAPTSVAVVGDVYWVAEGQITSSLLTGTPPHLPFTLRRANAD